ncbi:unnamed protein product [Arctia plantaginis]|uniref:CCHC-type domain-containing protein n=1 Tax=Arctia plantaginis TaxID=874455 RepID=A0A8S1AVR7_ARCPL|nr:unnamed protein product [Arctia plantaginis]
MADHDENPMYRTSAALDATSEVGHTRAEETQEISQNGAMTSRSEVKGKATSAATSASSSSGPRLRSDIICFRCGNAGHFATKCPRGNSGGAGAAGGASSSGAVPAAAASNERRVEVCYVSNPSGTLMNTALFGAPKRAIADQGRCFASKEFSHFCTSNNIELHLIATGVAIKCNSMLSCERGRKGNEYPQEYVDSCRG